MSLPPSSGSIASYLELSTKAYAANVAVFRKLVAAKCKVGAVLKGNAYGHGFYETLALAHQQVDALYVMTPAEGLAIRAWEAQHKLPPQNVLVMGAVSADECIALARTNVAMVVAECGFSSIVPHLRAAKLALDVHIHIDTGLGREGFTRAQMERGEVDFLSASADVLKLKGVLSHFANTEDVTQQSYALSQLEAFKTNIAIFSQRIRPPTDMQRHIAASAAVFVLPPSHYDAVRVGISLYGLWPSSQTRLSACVVLGRQLVLEPVLSWRAPSQVVKSLEAGSYVGYGCTWRCETPTRVAVLPVGYWDGYPRLASGKAHVLVNGQRCPVRGRVMMNHLIIDVTRATRDEGPLTATLLGQDGKEVISAETIADWAHTIHYEFLAGLGAHLRRVVLAG